MTTKDLFDAAQRIRQGFGPTQIAGDRLYALCFQGLRLGGIPHERPEGCVLRLQQTDHFAADGPGAAYNEYHCDSPSISIPEPNRKARHCGGDNCRAHC